MPLQVRVKATDDLNAVVRAAAPGTRLILAPGRYTGNIDIDRPLEITGDESGEAVVLGAQEGSCLSVTSPQTLI
jgi:nitrous oxidase accessory protein NosD